MWLGEQKWSILGLDFIPRYVLIDQIRMGQLFADVDIKWIVWPGPEKQTGKLKRWINNTIVTWRWTAADERKENNEIRNQVA